MKSLDVRKNGHPSLNERNVGHLYHTPLTLAGHSLMIAVKDDEAFVSFRQTIWVRINAEIRL
jgi:hypothetical protein